MINNILLRRKNKVYFEENFGKLPLPPSKDGVQLVVAIETDIQQLGYTLSRELAEQLAYYTYNDEIITKIYHELVGILRQIQGADVQYRCMYPNFPDQVKNANNSELAFNAIGHYLMPQWMPQYNKKVHLPYQPSSFTVLHLGTKEDLVAIFKNLVCSKINISPMDKIDIEAFTLFDKNWAMYLPREIPHREVKSLITSLLYRDGAYIRIPMYLTTPTDVLRFCVAYSSGDESLATVTYFKKMKRSMRRLIMDCLAAFSYNVLMEEMQRYEGPWKRLGEIIHPGEFKSEKYKDVRAAFHMIRNNNTKLTFMGEIEENLTLRRFDVAIDKLRQRPGEFARKLNRLLQMIKGPALQEAICLAFESVADQVSIPVLLQVSQFFQNCNTSNNVRVFFPKGQIAKVWFTDKKQVNLHWRVTDKIVQICENAIRTQLSSRSPLGNVYIDPYLHNYVIPFSQRSASVGKKPLERGSRIAISEDANIIRGFIHWTNNPAQRIDLDLSVIAYDALWNKLRHVSYTNLKSEEFGIVHSGDITNGGDVRGKGVAEFVDIDITQAKNAGARYVVFQVHNYTQFDFSAMKNCRFGWMERSGFANQGEIFEPSTVQNLIDLTAPGKIACPVIFDLQKRCFIWCDMIAPSRDYVPNNLENNLTTTTAVYYAMTNIQKPNLHTLIRLNAEARGRIVNKKEDADIVFSVDSGITPYDTDYIISELL